ncbi:MAG: hypothetical protein JNL82_03700 [Myxococcales bacterium]|nr:hypothetical protein [Myxococcales bacterium]
MIVPTKDLPEPARRPLLLALSLQALATRAGARAADVSADELSKFAAEFAALVHDARESGWLGEDVSPTLAEHAAPTRLKDVADAVWTVGLHRLQQLVAAGEWYPDELDLLIKPREEPLVSRDHLGLARRHGAHKLGFK